jgi:AcrR family transcriptional regulator
VSTTDAISFRDRLIGGMAQAVRERGFRDTTVAHVVAHARTSRRTFYEHFSSRDECFLALFDATSELLLNRISDAVDPDGDWERQVELAVDAYLGTVASEPEIASSFVRELPALGEAGSARMHAVYERFADQLVGLVDDGRGKVRPLSADAALILVSGLRELVASAIEQGRDVHDVRPAAVDVITAVLRPR